MSSEAAAVSTVAATTGDKDLCLASGGRWVGGWAGDWVGGWEEKGGVACDCVGICLVCAHVQIGVSGA